MPALPCWQGLLHQKDFKRSDIFIATFLFFCRANFEVATPSDDEAGSDENDNIGGGGVGEAGGGEGGRRSAPKIMDEDEWTEQNFGASSLVNVEGDEDGTNTSDDDVRWGILDLYY